jgi:hypothetical protein
MSSECAEEQPCITRIAHVLTISTKSNRTCFIWVRTYQKNRSRQFQSSVLGIETRQLSEGSFCFPKIMHHLVLTDSFC